MVHVENLKKNFGKLEVLKDISIDIMEGEVVVLIGPSGSGKSTFLRCLNQLETATAGRIVVDGSEVTDKHTDINKVRENIGMVFQHFNLFNNKNVIQNITLAPVELKLMSKEEAKEKGMQLLKRVGLDSKAEAYPSQLSGGQKQRVAIARALAMNPDVIIIPTNNMANGQPDFTADEVLADEQLKEIIAVKNGAVYNMPTGFEAWDSPVPSGVLGMLWMTAKLHPEVYTMEEFAADAADFYKTFYGFDMDTSSIVG